MQTAEGPLLTVNVSERDWKTQNIDKKLSKYVGGRGITTKFAHEKIPFNADPLGPRNRLFFSTGPFQYSNMSFTGRMSLTGLSPLTNGLFSSNAGGYLSRNFIATGNSVIEISGESEFLIGIHISDGSENNRPKVEFVEVPELQQAEVPEVTDYVRSNNDEMDRENLATIGPAGENLVRFASVMTYDHRAFGRGGLGAVLGSKNIKFISFSGESEIKIEDTDKHKEVHRKAAVEENGMKRQGTNAGTQVKNDVFSLPTRYFAAKSFEGVENINGEAIESKKYKKGACSMCAFACKLPTKDEDSGFTTEGPEFETVFSFGSNCAIDNLTHIMKSNELCDRLGLDTISAGDTIAAYLSSKNEFGNEELVHNLIDKIAYREGIGDTLAEGIDRIYEELSVDNWSVKGLEFPGHDGRVMYPVALSYAVGNAGADHMYGRIHKLTYNGDAPTDSLDGAAELVVRRENRAAVRDSAILCAFGDQKQYVSLEGLAELLDTSTDTVSEIGSRIITLERHFNNQRGINGGDDKLPYDIPNLDDAISNYYGERGWTDDGEVPPDKVP